VAVPVLPPQAGALSSHPPPPLSEPPALAPVPVLPVVRRCLVLLSLEQLEPLPPVPIPAAPLPAQTTVPPSR